MEEKECKTDMKYDNVFHILEGYNEKDGSYKTAWRWDIETSTVKSDKYDSADESLVANIDGKYIEFVKADLKFLVNSGIEHLLNRSTNANDFNTLVKPINNVIIKGSRKYNGVGRLLNLFMQSYNFSYKLTAVVEGVDGVKYFISPNTVKIPRESLEEYLLLPNGNIYTDALFSMNNYDKDNIIWSSKYLLDVLQ